MSDKAPIQNVQIFDPNYGGNSRIAPNGSHEMAELIRLVGGNFQDGDLLGNLWRQNDINGGSSMMLDGEMVLSTNTAADGEARVQTFKRARFITGTFNKSHMAIQYSPSWDAADVVRSFGIYDPFAIYAGGTVNGVRFVNTSGVFTLERLRGGSVVENISEGSFNGATITGVPTNTLTKDDNVHIYEFQYNAGRIDFIQDGKLIHRMTSLLSVAYNTPHLPGALVCQNINGNTANNQLKSRGFSISRIGSLAARPERFRITGTSSGTLKNGPGTLRSVLISDVGNGIATINLYDSATPSGDIIDSIDVSENLVDLAYELDFDFGLSFDVSGTGISILVLYD